VSRHFSFDPRIEGASTIPARLYVDPVYLELEYDRVFGRTWQLVGHAKQAADHGQFFTTAIGQEPIVVLRDGEALRGFHNVCLHRAGPVAQGCGQRTTLQCRYHGWTYRLNGELLQTPGMDGVERFSRDDMRLLPIQVDVWGPLIFANLDPKAPALGHFLEDIPDRARVFRLDAMRFVERKDYVVECNWKVYIDNYLEGYHIPMVHQALHKELDDQRYRVETRRYYSVQHAPLRPPGPGRTFTTTAGRDAAQYYWLFPNVMLNVYFDQLQTNVVLPQGPDRTLVRFEWFSSDPAMDPADPGWRRKLAFSDTVQQEDAEICAVVQRNLRSRVYDRGRYSPGKENGVHHFHGLLHEFLT
jgi:choline monooxygenase